MQDVWGRVTAKKKFRISSRNRILCWIWRILLDVLLKLLLYLNVRYGFASVGWVVGLALSCCFLALFLLYVVGALCSLVLVSTWVCSGFWRQFSIFLWVSLDSSLCLSVSLDSSLCLLLMQLVLYFDQWSFFIHKKGKNMAECLLIPIDDPPFDLNIYRCW